MRGNAAGNEISETDGETKLLSNEQRKMEGEVSRLNVKKDVEEEKGYLQAYVCMCTLVMKTLVMLSGLSPSGLGGPSSCSPSPFSKLCRKAGFRMCCSTYETRKTQ